MEHADYLAENTEYNSFGGAFLLSLLNLLPIIGTIISVILILNKIFRVTKEKIFMFIGLMIPVLNIITGVYFFVLLYKRIGLRFLLGYISSIFFIMAAGILAAIVIPPFKSARDQAMIKVIKADIASLNSALDLYIISAPKTEYPVSPDFNDIRYSLKDMIGTFVKVMPSNPFGSKELKYIYEYKSDGNNYIIRAGHPRGTIQYLSEKNDFEYLK